jgi:hypothetical protein
MPLRRCLQRMAAGLMILSLSAGAMAQVQLSGTFVDLFFNPTGDLIAPLDADGNKQIYNKLDPTQGGRGILYTPFPDNPAKPKKELIAWSGRPAEGWGLNFLLPGAAAPVIIGNGSDGFGAANLASNIEVSKSLDERTLTFKMDLTDEQGNDPLVRLTQVVNYNLTDQKVRFDIYVENISTMILGGVSYLRTVNPRQGVDLYIPAVFDTDKRPDSPYFIDAITGKSLGISVDSVVFGKPEQDENQRHLALASDLIGTRVNAVGDADINIFKRHSLIESPEGSPLYGRLDGFDADGNPIISYSSSDLDAIFRDADAAINLWFGPDVIGDIRPGDNRYVGTFFYVFGGPKIDGGPVIPEPGPLALLSGFMMSALLLLVSRRPCRKRR